MSLISDYSDNGSNKLGYVLEVLRDRKRRCCCLCELVMIICPRCVM
jgi:hypothetical protein